MSTLRLNFHFFVHLWTTIFYEQQFAISSIWKNVILIYIELLKVNILLAEKKNQMLTYINHANITFIVVCYRKVKELRREIEKGWMDRIGGIQGIQGGHLHLRQHFLDWVWCCACAVAVQCYKVMQLVTGMVLHTAPTLPGSTLNPQPTTLRTQVLIPEYTTSKIIFYQKFTKQYGITMVLMA